VVFWAALGAPCNAHAVDPVTPDLSNTPRKPRVPGLPLADPIEVKRRLAAIFAADVEGYSRLMGLDEVATLNALTARREILDGLIASHGGRIANTAGDSVLAEFGSAVDAVRCAMEAQDALAKANSTLPEDRHINFRIGVHVGDVMVRAGDLFGDGINIAARLQTLARAGGLCISGVTYDQVRKILPLDFKDLGAQKVKNIEEPIRAYEVKAEGEVAFSPSKDASSPGDRRPLPLPDKPSIAVLPFQNMSGDPEQDYFADGMVEDIITALSRFKSLFVIARNSSFIYKGKTVDIKQVGRELGVQYALEGSVRRVGEKVRITTQLIDAASGNHVWADRFDGNLHDVFEMQDSVTARVVGSIAPTLSEAELETVSRKPIENWSSYDYYLRGQKMYHEGNQRGQAKATRAALELFRKAVDLDPTFGRAYARLAQSIQVIRDLHSEPISEEERTEALRCAELAVQLSGDDAMALVNLVFVFGMLNGDFERGAELADRALALNPNLSQAWNALGIMRVVLGDHERALDAFAKAMRLNPIDKVAIPFTLFGMAAACLMLGRYEEGAGFARRVLALQPNDIRGLFTLTGNTYFSGQLAEAEATVAQIKQYHPHFRSSHLRQAYRVRRPADMAAVERAIAFIGLPE
jgi:TolB-like protein/class 3 adenylate cyclase/Tfp pilus assembly protein PilF